VARFRHILPVPHSIVTGSLHQQIDMHRTAIATADEQLPLIEAGIERTVPTKGDAFAMTQKRLLTAPAFIDPSRARY